MKLSTLTLVGASSMVATAAAVWLTIDPAQGSRALTTDESREATRGGGGSLPAPPVGEGRESPPGIDRSHFTAGKTLMVEGRLGHPTLPADTESETFLYVDVSADAGRTAAHVPLELAIVIDRSGSMKGKRLANAMAATRKAIERLRDGDTVSIVTYDTVARVVVSPTRVDAAARAQIIRQLGTLRASGDTCISCGIETGMRLLGRRTGAVRRVMLLSDGIATAGMRDLPGFRRLAEDCRRMGASITTIGVDVDYDERVMAALARDSNGGHHFVIDAGGLPAIFDKEMQTLTRTVADGAELVVDLAPGVFADHVFDRVTVATGSQVVIPLGTFTSGEKKTALIRLRVPRGPAGERPIAAVRLRYDDLVDQKPGTSEGQLAAIATADPSRVAPLDGIVSARVSSSETAETLEEANALFRAGRGDDATRLLRTKAARLDGAKQDARNATPTAGADKLEDRFDRQRAALDQAATGFSAPTPAAAPPSPQDHDGKANIRSNQADAFDLGK